MTRAAFAEYAGFLDPPSGALRETVDSVRRDLEVHGGAIAWLEGEAPGCLRFDIPTTCTCGAWPFSRRGVEPASARR